MVRFDNFFWFSGDLTSINTIIDLKVTAGIPSKIEAQSTISLTTSSYDKDNVMNELSTLEIGNLNVDKTTSKSTETDNDPTSEPNVLFTSINPDLGTDESDILLTTIDSEVINIKEVLNINNDVLNLDIKETTVSVLFTSTEGNNLVENKTTTAQTTTETTQQPQSTTQTTQQPQTTSETTTTTTERTEEGGLGDLAFSIATQGNEILNSVFRTIFGLG